MVSRIAYLYFSFLAWGCLVLLPVVRLQEVGQGFYRFFGFTCLGLQTLAVGLALMTGLAFQEGFQTSWAALGISLVLTLCFTVSLRIRVRWFLWGCFWGAVGSGGSALGYFPWAGSPHLVFQVLHAVSSALLLGAGVLAMMLGHWYLVTPRLSITPLKRYAAGYILLTVWKALEVGVSYFFDGGLVHGEMIFVLFRITWGLAAPLGMAYWIWTTVSMKSTQSATGILYASLVCTLIGEGMGLYLTLRTGVPF